MGEPASISSEITLKTWKNHRKKLDPFIFFGDPSHLLQTCTKLKFKVPIKIIKKKNIDVFGPYPADTIFNKKISKKFDVIICMYHDQATIPIKTLDFENGVNVTLGLPIIRTSPDHGTALDIAGKGVASEKSLYASIKMSQYIAKKRKLWIQ